MLIMWYFHSLLCKNNSKAKLNVILYILDCYYSNKITLNTVFLTKRISFDIIYENTYNLI